MEIINGYSTEHNLSQIFKFRLFHHDHPGLKQWRATRHGTPYCLDETEQLAIKYATNNQLISIDCVGWALSNFGLDVQCFESNPIALHYNPGCHIEPDLFTHRPTYARDCTVLTRYPWFLKYSTLPEFINFLELWTRSTMILNFYERFIQHNYLKHKLIDLVRDATDIHIQEISKNLWVLTR